MGTKAGQSGADSRTRIVSVRLSSVDVEDGHCRKHVAETWDTVARLWEGARENPTVAEFAIVGFCMKT